MKNYRKNEHYSIFFLFLVLLFDWLVGFSFWGEFLDVLGWFLFFSLRVLCYALWFCGKTEH